MISLDADKRMELFGNNATYRNDNLFIEAGAGAGKTDTIMKKIIDQLLQGILPERFIVITFTKKATEEMKNRIIKAVNEKNNDKDLSLEERKILENAAINLHKMQISTIHSFCNRILNENSFAARISYGTNLLEEEDEEARQKALFYVWKKALGEENNEKISNLPIEHPENALLETYLALCNKFDDIKINADIPDVFNDCLSLINEILDIASGAPSNYVKNKSFVKFLDTYNSGNVEDLTELNINNVDDYSYILEIMNRATFKIGFNAGKNEEIKMVNEELETLSEKAKILHTSLALYPKKIINQFALDAWKYYKENKDRENLSNNQLIFETYRLISENKEILDKLAKAYDVIYIDEFQDTDVYQIKFVTLLARSIDERKKYSGQPLTSSLIIVGDPKQSIYKFRGADVRSFITVRDEFSSYGDNFINVYFPDNFRSNNFIIDYVNERYQTADFGYGYKYSNMLVPKRHQIENSNKNEYILAGVYSYPFNVDKDDERGYNKFTNTVNLIRFLVENKYKIYKNSKADYNVMELREIEYKDFLILTCSKSEIYRYAEEFLNKGISLQIVGEFPLSMSEIIRINYRVLAYLLEPNESNYRLAINTLINYYDNPKYVIDKLEMKVNSLSPYGTFLYVFKNFTYKSHYFTNNQKLLYDSAFIQLFEMLCVNTNLPKHELLLKIEEYLRNYQQSEIQIDSNADQVRIMNAHQAKGLQGYILIIADSGGKMSTGDRVNEVNGVNYLNNISLFPKENEINKLENKQENTRLEYVDITRAEQVIIFEENFSSANERLFKGEKFLNENLNKYQLENTCLPKIDLVNSTYGEKKNSPSQISSTMQTISNLEIHNKVLLKETSPSALENEVVISNENQIIHRPNNNTFGDMLHRSMELFVLNRNSYDLPRIINTVINENKEKIDGEVELYSTYLTKCISALIQYFNENHILENKEIIEPEYKFITYDMSISSLLSGSIDLLLISNNNATIIDYKSDITGFTSNEEFSKVLIKRYRKQLEAYSRVVEKIFNPKDISLNIIYIEEKEDREIPHIINLTLKK